MTDRRSTAAGVYDEPRQAVGWLTSRWAGSLVVVLVWAVLLGDRATDVALGTWWSVTATILLLGLGVLNVWGYRVSSDAGPRLREGASQRELSWWQRERFGAEQAAERLGWGRGPVVWTTWALMALGAVATLAALVVLALRWS